MIRIVLVYLVVASTAIVLVTGVPFGPFFADGHVSANSDLETDRVRTSNDGSGDGQSQRADTETLNDLGGLNAGSASNSLGTGPSDPALAQEEVSSNISPIADLNERIIPDTHDPVGEQDAAFAAQPSELSQDSGTFAQTAPSEPREVTMEFLLARLMDAGLSADEIDHLLNEAVSQGSVRVHAMMLTTEGRVDTAVLMAALVAQTSTAPNEQGDTSGDDSYITPETAILDIQDMTYLVQSGDSLGSVAMKFYGNPNLFKPIFEANRNILSTPSSIRTGQTLLIPSRSKL